MAQVYMRNKLTGEFRDVEPDSPEFRELQAQVTSTGQTMWEQTNSPHADAIKERAAYGELKEEDLGHEDQAELLPEAIRLDLEGVAPEANPHLALSPGEVEAGLTVGQKLQDLAEQFEQRVLGRRLSILDKAANRISDERKEREAAAPSKGQLARAGGSDDRDNVPRTDASQQEATASSGSSSSGSSGGGPSRTPAASGAASGGGDQS